MASPTPLKPLFDNAQAVWEFYGLAGPADAAGSRPAREPVGVAAAFDFVDLEYAAIRKASGLLDQPHRGTLVLTGADRLTFLNRMVTQELKDAKPFESRRAFWLNRKGRIDADLRLVVLEDRVIADLECFSAARAKETLDAFLIADDVTIENASARTHRLALHGPGGPAVLASLSKHIQGDEPASLAPGRVSVVEIAGRTVVVDRHDTAGEIGLELTLDAPDATAVFLRLLEAAHEPREGHSGPNLHARLKPIGWHAYNVARIEAGTPLYMIDFGPDALPAESGVLHDRVSFKKGCYLGQEVVARMNALGHPKQTLVGLRFEDGPHQSAATPLPPGGAPVFASPGPAAAGSAPSEPVGTIASSTSAPMLGGVSVALAMVRFKHAQPGTPLVVPCVEHPEATPVLRQATVQPSLVFWARDALAR